MKALVLPATANINLANAVPTLNPAAATMSASAKAAAANTLPANATRLWSAARQIRSDKEPAAAENISPASARANIYTTLPTVLRRARYRALLAGANIPAAPARRA